MPADRSRYHRRRWSGDRPFVEEDDTGMGLQRVFNRLTGGDRSGASPVNPAAPPVERSDPPTTARATATDPTGAALKLPVHLPTGAGRDDLDEVADLIARGCLVEAVDALAAANRRAPDPALETALVALRHDAAVSVPRSAGRSPWPPVYADPFPEVSGRLPEVAAAELTTEVLGGAVAHHGALIVRGIFSADQVERTVTAIERAHRRHEAEAVEGAGTAGTGGPVGDDDGSRHGDDQPFEGGDDEGAWYRPFPATGHDEVLRRMVARDGGTWLADSPSSTARILDELEACGVTAAITAHLGERPYFSLHKSTLRRSLPVNKIVGWHQDGSFYDPDVRTMNVWVALSACGGSQPSPGMELIPRRFEEILPVAGEPTKHSISYDLIAELAADCPTVIPEFAPGDGLLFDEHFVHRTHLAPGMTEIRYALECWFFAPSHLVSNYVPLLA